MEEVKRQVALAMQGRDQEVTALKQRNEQLERALMEANTAMRTMKTGGTAGRTEKGTGILLDNLGKIFLVEQELLEYVMGLQV